jgi:predicted RNase H-like nuclease
MCWDATTLTPLFTASVTDAVDGCQQDGPLDVVGNDIPIGVADASLRQADLLARDRFGPRRGSVFPAPVRAAVTAETYVEANEQQRALVGQGLSRQSYALRDKILEVDRFVRSARCRVVEVRPELSFATLAGAPLVSTKRTWGGMSQRRRVLADAGLAVPDDVGELGAGRTPTTSSTRPPWPGAPARRNDGISRRSA